MINNMTNEQAINILEHARLMSGFPEQIKFSFDAEGKEALEMAIQALKQQPCEDCISLNKLDDIITKAIDDSENQTECQTLRWVLDVMSELPSVTPQPKTGHWIIEEVKDEDGRPYDIKYFCSECQAERPPIWDDYCSACGAKMEVEDKESEE